MQIENCFYVEAIEHDKTIITDKIIDNCVQEGETVTIHSGLKEKSYYLWY